MAAGKTTVGRALAARLAIDYLDNDVLLQEREGLDTVALAARGRQVLHAAESRQLRALCERRGAFVAGVAASVADRPDDGRLMRATATVVYLRADPGVLASRVGRDPARPWVDGDATAVLTDMFRRRDPVLRAVAHLTVEADRPVDRILEQIEAMTSAADESGSEGAATPAGQGPVGGPEDSAPSGGIR